MPPSTRGIVEPSFVTFAADFKAEWRRRFGASEKTVALRCHLYMNAIFLPRQAREQT
jgi:hypothetical protein